MSAIPTIKVKHDSESGVPFRIINECEFNPDIMEIYVEQSDGDVDTVYEKPVTQQTKKKTSTKV